MTNATDLERLKEEFEAIARERARLLLHTPRHSLRVIRNLSGVSPARIRSWLTRNAIRLDANEGHREGTHRLFTGADVLRIVAVQRFSQLGLPLTWASDLAEVVVEYIQRALCRPQGMPRNPIYVACPADGHLEISGPFFQDTPRDLAGHQLPPVGIIFKPLEIGAEVLSALGYSVACGTADELRARANELDRG